MPVISNSLRPMPCICLLIMMRMSSGHLGMNTFWGHSGSCEGDLGRVCPSEWKVAIWLQEAATKGIFSVEAVWPWIPLAFQKSQCYRFGMYLMGGSLLEKKGWASHWSHASPHPQLGLHWLLGDTAGWSYSPGNDCLSGTTPGCELSNPGRPVHSGSWIITISKGFRQ